ncbi:DUF4199 domain-containing protein [Polaribacter sp. Hel_I_88]|uniref:DUF4199 domain-containing protein n=1 Tax=Polaribacter sp. Hel_I_88 TaxID=1250006 RepID=UPI00047A7B13|nr:DUF4199 domain-containing protein [Polaribacter sp. Hel_I_88]
MSQRKIIIKNALLIVLMISGFFFLSKLLGQEDNPYLRFLNIVFVILGIRQAVKESIAKNGVTNYGLNFGSAFATGALSVLISSVGVLLYIEFISPEFLDLMNNNFLIGGDLDVFEVFFSLMIEGLASSIVGALIVMQFFKNHDKSDTKAS